MAEQREFGLDLASITQSERRYLAREHGVNWDVKQIDLRDIPRPADPDAPTDEEGVAAARAFFEVIGPVEQFALLCVAVRRKIPDVTTAEVERRSDAEEWSLTLGKPKGGASGPLPRPPASSTPVTI